MLTETLLEDRQAPLFGRTTFDILLGPWAPSAVFDVAERHGAGEPNRTLTLRTLFGGVPKYWRDFANADALNGVNSWREWALDMCRALFLRVDAPLREEGDAAARLCDPRGSVAPATSSQTRSFWPGSGSSGQPGKRRASCLRHGLPRVF